MVLRRIPGRNWGTKFSTFGFIMLAGIEEIFHKNKVMILQKFSIESLSKIDHPVLPDYLKLLHYQPKSPQSVKKLPILNSEEQYKTLRFYEILKISKSFYKGKNSL